MYLLFIALVPAPAATALPATVIRSSHSGAITAIESTVDELLFTAGSDGKVKVWALDDGRLVQDIQADRLPVRAISLYPDDRRVAVLSGSRRSNRISVWDWREGELLFVRSISTEVIHFGVSPDGSYIHYTTPTLESVHLLDGRTGRELPFLRRPTGIVNWAMVGSSEERIVSYVPATGTVSYYDIVSGRTVAEFSGPSGLTIHSILDQRRYAVALDREGLLIILDLLTGDAVAQLPVGSVRALRVEPSTGDIVVLADDFSGRPTFRRYGFDGRDIRQKYEIRRTIPETTSAFALAAREILGADFSGRIHRWPAFENEPVEMARPTIVPIRDAVLSGNRLHLLTAEGIVSVTSDFLDHRETPALTSYARERRIPDPMGPESRFITRDPLNLYVWTPENGEAPLRRFRFYGVTLPLDFSLPVVPRFVSARDDQLLVISAAGEVNLLDESGTELFRYRGIGLQAAISTPFGIFAGKTVETAFDSSLVRISPLTGETVPLSNDADLIFSFAFDERRGRLFSLGVAEDERAGLATVLQVHEGSSTDRSRTVLSIPGEHLDSHVLVDETTGNTFTTLDDRGGILRWDGRRVSELARNTARVPLRLRLSDGLLVATNTDGTLSTYEASSGEHRFDLAFVELGNGRIEWIVVINDGRFYTPSDTAAEAAYVSSREELRRRIPTLSTR